MLQVLSLHLFSQVIISVDFDDCDYGVDAMQCWWWWHNFSTTWPDPFALMSPHWSSNALLNHQISHFFLIYISTASVHLTGGTSPPLSFNWLQLSSIPLQPALLTHLSQDSLECATPCPGKIIIIIITTMTMTITITIHHDHDHLTPQKSVQRYAHCPGRKLPPTHFNFR